MPNLDFLGKKLQSRDAEERREAALDLGRAGREAIPILLKALGDADWRVRKTAVEGLVAFDGGEVIQGFIRCLSSHDNAGTRNSAIEGLIHIGPRSVDALLAALDSPDADVRKFIVDILGDIRDRRAGPALIAKLDDLDENIRVSAAEALGKLREPAAVDALIACLSRYDQGWLDYAAAEALGEIGDERALGPLLSALGRSSLREPVLESLGKIGNVKTVAPLLAGLSDPLRIVREVSTVALGGIYRKIEADDRRSLVATVREGLSERAVDYLEEILLTGGGELLKSAVAVLGWAGRDRSVEKLLMLLKEEEMEEPVVQALKHLGSGGARLLAERLRDGNALVRRAVARVLGEIGGAEAEPGLIDLLADENGHVRSNAAEALGSMKSVKAVAQLLPLLEDEYQSVQESAIEALAAIGDDSILDALVRNFTSQDAVMRKNIALLLGRLRTAKAVDALAFALKDEEPDVRKAVVHALGSTGGERGVRSLMLAVTDDDPEVRMLAAEALGRSAPAEAEDILISLLADEDLWVRAAAARGLGRIGGTRAGVALAEHLEAATDIFLLALAEVAGKLRIPGALGPLLRLTDHPDPEVRKVVLVALAGYGGAEVQRAVLSRLGDQHWSVRKAAVEIVRQTPDASAAPLLERMAEGDPDLTVRQAAREALGR